jgi:hypothetical protein
MRFVQIILVLALIAPTPRGAAQKVTIAQLREFLLAQRQSKHPDPETADRLSSVSLSERLTPQSLEQLIAQTNPGPESFGQLQILAEASVFAPPSEPENPPFPAPSSEQQRTILAAGIAYAQNALRHLPDFLAVRDTRRYDNKPLPLDKNHDKARIRLHWTGEFKNQITYRHGAEIAEDPQASQSASGDLAIHPGLVSLGEFGPILSLVFSDSTHGSIAWARWEPDPEEGKLAVFRFTVPKSASHYLVDFCCYSNLAEENQDLSFRDHPAYHGEVILNPDSGVIRRITIEADLDPSAPVTASQLAVQYGNVDIGGRSYVCPVRSIAVIASRNIALARIDGHGVERHVNEIQYLHYRKFGSTSRMVTGP